MTEHPADPSGQIRWWTIEDDPLTDGYAVMAYVEDGTFQRVDYTAKADALPDEVRAALVRLMEVDFDAASCEADQCLSVVCGGTATPAPVGYFLAGDADEYTVWRWASLVLIPADVDHPNAEVLAVCEDCDPGNAYTRRADRS